MASRMKGRNFPFAAAILAITWLAGSAPAAEPGANLRQRALALNNVTGEDPIEGQVNILVDDTSAAKKLLAAALPLAQEKKQPFNYNGAYILARTAASLHDLEAGQIFYQICLDKAQKLKSVPKLGQSYLGLLGLLTAQKKYAECVSKCREILEMDAEEKGIGRLKSQVVLVMIEALAKQGKTGEALKLADNLVEARPDDWKTLQIKAMVLHEVGKNEEAAKVYEQILEKIRASQSLSKEEKTDLIDSCRYILSNVYIDMNQIDKATEQLKALLAEKPNDPTYNNDLGYIWADHDMNLAAAEKMIRKALEEDRKERHKNPKLKPEDDHDNAAYLDSLGWVLFKQKKYKEAKVALLKAVQDKKEGQHAEIYDHLGEVNKSLGDKAGAIAAWKKAVELASQNKREQERKTRIENKLKNLK